MGFDFEIVVLISCIYILIYDGVFVFDCCGWVVVGVGFLGYGFKFVLGVGGVLVDFVIDLDVCVVVFFCLF